MISIEAHRATIGRYYNKARLLSNSSDLNTKCYCKRFEELIFHLSTENYLTMIQVLHGDLLNVRELRLSTEKDLEFCIVMIETIFDVSFLKILQLLVDGDIESNPGPTDNIEKTPRGKGRPKKSKGFRGTTPNKVNNSLTLFNDVSSAPIGLVNIANDCFLGLASSPYVTSFVSQSVSLSQKFSYFPPLDFSDFLHEVSLQ